MTPLRAPELCISCGLRPRRTLRLGQAADLVRCPGCGLGWWQWSEFDPARFYGEAYFQSTQTTSGYNDYAALEPGLRRTARTRLKCIASVAPARRTRSALRLLDIGCGSGVFLDEATRRGWDVAGLEVSAYAAAEARRRNLRVETGTAEDASLPADAYDCITLWDAIEHLRDPLRVLRAASAAVRPGGILAISTGDLDSLCAQLSGQHWHLFNLPEHLFFFSPRSLRAVLERAGFRPVRVTREVYWAPVGYIRERLRKMLGRPALGRRFPFDEFIIPASLLDVIGIYAVRAGRTL